MDTLQTLFMLVGGLGLFLFGIKQMEEGLRRIAGDYLKRLMSALTKNRLTAILLGFIVTTLAQSSSATTSMVVGFINAGLMTLQQALGFVLGAAIGTTTTGQLMSLNLDYYALLILGIGAFILLFSPSERERLRNVGLLMLGLGTLFFGMVLMKQAMLPLKESGTIAQWLVLCNANTAWSITLGVIVGIGCSALIHSGGTVGVLIALGSSGAITDLAGVIPLLLGCGIGTCITALVVSIRACQAAKKAAIVHTIFKLFECLVILASFPLWTWLIPLTAHSIERQIANAHTIFAVVGCLLFLPLIPLVLKLLNKVYPDRVETTIDLLTKYRNFDKSEFLNKKHLETPEIALMEVRREINVMVQIVAKMITALKTGIVEQNDEKVAKVLKYEDIIDNIKRDIHDYIILLSQHNLTNKQAIELTVVLEGASDMERAADHIESMLRYIQLVKQGTMVLDENNKSKIEGVLTKAIEVVQLVQACTNEYSMDTLKNITTLEKQLDKDVKTSREYYEYCLRSGSWNPPSDLSFVELLTSIEKFYRHCGRFNTKYIRRLHQLDLKQIRDGFKEDKPKESIDKASCSNTPKK